MFAHRAAFLPQQSLRPFNRLKVPLQSSHRHLFFFRRRPLYKPTTAFGRTYLRLRNFTLGVVTISVVTVSIFYLLDARSSAHRYIFTPALRLITPDPEDAHRIAVLALKYGLHPKDTIPDNPRLAVEVFPRLYLPRYGVKHCRIRWVLQQDWINKLTRSMVCTNLDFRTLKSVP